MRINTQNLFHNINNLLSYKRTLEKKTNVLMNESQYFGLIDVKLKTAVVKINKNTPGKEYKKMSKFKTTAT